MTDYQILNAIDKMDSSKKSRINGWILLIVSGALFVGAGAMRWDWKLVIYFVVAIFIHELGHLMAMKLFKYKNLKMMFLPFIGGAASGQTDEQDSYKIAMISIFGPFVGFLSCYISVILGTITDQQIFFGYARLSLILNAFNLLPILPLDGGQYLNETLFSRFPRVEMVFKILAILGLAFLAFKLEGWILGIIAFVMLLSLPASYKMAVAAKDLRSDENLSGNDLTVEKVGLIRDRIHDANPTLENNEKALINAIKGTWIRVNKTFPSLPKTCFLVVVYIVMVFAFVPFTMGFITGIERSESGKPETVSEVTP